MSEPIECSVADDSVTSHVSAVRISSPVATGGAGSIFEQHVGAYWLAQLLVGAIPPILIDCSVGEVHFQTEHLGWQTDDFLVVGRRADGEVRKLAGQVKKSFAVSATDNGCKETLLNLWRDYKSPDRFSAQHDRLAIVTQRGANTVLRDLGSLLDCSRAANDGDEFQRRLAVRGFISAKAVHYCGEVLAIVGELEHRELSAAEIWSFLRVLHILSLDLASTTRQGEASIKSLLALTAADASPVEAATNSWNTLLALTGEAMPSARTFRRQDLPKFLLDRHASGARGQPTLSALQEHTDVVLRGIRSAVGSGLHLARAGLVQRVIGMLGESQVVLLSGPAGTGKSAVAKDVLKILSKDYFTFCFRGEEFGHPHFDTTLQNSQIPGRAAALSAVLASQDRKLLLVESVERLLEKATRDAFTDLLTLAKSDKSLGIILTCRDYSTDLVRACFLQSTDIDHLVIEIPTLNDEELQEVESAYPALALPLARPALREIMRNLYVLDKALRIQWSPNRPMPESERKFRTLFWQDVVRADHHIADGMPRRREQVFSGIAVRRAKSLTLYVDSTDFDPTVITALRADSLLINCEQNDKLVAPAHDVLEDWAILGWIEGQHSPFDGSFHELFDTIRTYPALRRAYRRWISELLEFDAGSGDRLFRSAVVDDGAPSSFRDDTLISLLRSRCSPAFLKNHAADLLANENELFRRVVHLLRVACVMTPAWLKGKVKLFNIPEGPAWPVVLRLARTNLDRFKPRDYLLLLGLIEDWSLGVTEWAPCPEGAEAVPAIAHYLLPRFDNYANDEERKRTLHVIAKVPNGDPEQFARLLRGTKDRIKPPDRVARELQDIIFAGMEGTPAAKYMPDVVVSVLLERLLCSESDLHRELPYAGSPDWSVEFGLKPNLGLHCFPASAFRTPALPLLRHHPQIGLKFLFSVFNHSAEWYAHPRLQERFEAPVEVDLRFGDGTIQGQWCNPRLWNLYRGTSVGPYLLQSFLMALERWLLEVAEAEPRSLDSLLLRVLQQSKSGALTAVVASVATAFPLQAGETLLTFLRSPVCILLDRQRLVAEAHTASSLLGSLVKNIQAENSIYQKERADADVLPHRSRDLEAAIIHLQCGPFAARVHEVLDKHRKGLPPISEQDDENRIWRLAIHRMDLRKYSVSEDISNSAEVQPADHKSFSSNQRRVLLTPEEPEPDVKKLVDKTSSHFAAINAKLGLLMWGLKNFKREDADQLDAESWHQKLEQSRTANMTSADEAIGAQGGPGIIAAVCVRDHWQELRPDEQDWCARRVCAEIMRESNNWNEGSRAQRFDMSADRACAWAGAALISRFSSGALVPLVQQAFVAALTHPTDEVRWYATLGIAELLWQTDHDLAMRCVNAIAGEANTIADLQAKEKARPHKERRSHDEICAEAAGLIRAEFWKVGSIASDAVARLDDTQWRGVEAFNRILAIFGKAPAEPAAIAAFSRAGERIAECWRQDDDHTDSLGQRNREAELQLPWRTSEFVMRVPFNVAETILGPILHAVDRPARGVHSFVLGLLRNEDNEPNTDHFWFLWKLFAVRVQRADWIADLDDEYSTGRELISAMFLGTGWKEGVRHWRSLEGQAHHVHHLFDSLPPSSTVFEEYVRFLYHVGEQSLPEAFERLARRLRESTANRLLDRGNTVYMLEVLLQRYVYAKPLELKLHRNLREAVLFLLDQLVESGSSACFQMRDDFVTPIPVR